MMPLLHDMPAGPVGLSITSQAIKLVVLGKCTPPCFLSRPVKVSVFGKSSLAALRLSLLQRLNKQDARLLTDARSAKLPSSCLQFAANNLLHDLVNTAYNQQHDVDARHKPNSKTQIACVLSDTVNRHKHADMWDAIVAGVACVMYGTIGIFGAARYGQQTEGDCLVNTWLGGRKEGWIDLAMAFYLSISIPPMQVCPCCPVMQHLLTIRSWRLTQTRLCFAAQTRMCVAALGW